MSQDNYAHITDADNQPHCVARSSATTIMIMGYTGSIALLLRRKISSVLSCVLSGLRNNIIENISNTFDNKSYITLANVSVLTHQHSEVH